MQLGAVRKLLDSRLARIQGLKPIQESEDQDRKWLILNPEQVTGELVFLNCDIHDPCLLFLPMSLLVGEYLHLFNSSNFKFKDLF